MKVLCCRYRLLLLTFNGCQMWLTRRFTVFMANKSGTDVWLMVSQAFNERLQLRVLRILMMALPKKRSLRLVVVSFFSVSNRSVNSRVYGSFQRLSWLRVLRLLTKFKLLLIIQSHHAMLLREPIEKPSSTTGFSLSPKRPLLPSLKIWSTLEIELPVQGEARLIS